MVEAGLHEALHRSGHRGLGGALGVTQQLLQKQRVAGRTLDASPRELAVGVKIGLGERGGLSSAQRPEIDGHERTAAGAGAPGVVERVALDPRGHDQDGAAGGRRIGKARQVIEGGLIGPVHVLDGEQEGRQRAGLAHQRGDRFARAAAARRAVHGVIERAQIGRLRQVQKIVQEHAPLGERGVRGDRPLECRLAGRRLAGAQPEQTAHQRPDGVLAGRRAEVQDQTGVTGKTPRRGPALPLLEQSGLADAGLATEVYRLPRADVEAGLQRAIELRDLGASADEHLAERLRLVTHAASARRPPALSDP